MALIVSQGKYKLCACYLLQENFTDYVFHFNTSDNLIFQQHVGFLFHLKKRTDRKNAIEGLIPPV